MSSSSRGDRYDAPYERRSAAGEDVHGEAHFVRAFSPTSVLDAGCGTGRVGRELARQGIEVVGVDLDDEMLMTARTKAPSVPWIQGDIATIELGRTFSVVLLAGNVMNFVTPVDRRRAAQNMARHVAPGGLLINGHSIIPGGCSPEDFDAWTAAAGLTLAERWSTWQRDAYDATSDYDLSVHRRPPGL
jgi:SAM-dependent methyltransferase